jgi:murein DD-endopeptidase MepM/ murein hydrolase activator NlpD
MRWLVLLLCLLAGAAAADDLALTGQFTQGGLVFGQATPGTRVQFDGRDVRLTPDSRFVIGFGRDFPAEAKLTVTWPDGRRETRTLAISRREYDIQRIDGLPGKMVTPPPETLRRIRDEAAQVAAARARDSVRADFLQPFAWPKTGRISGVYGSQRILNGQPRQPHFGVDVAGPVGAPVVAPAGGEIVLAEPDMYFTGGTIMIDHGHGLTSVLMHLSAVDVTVGQVVRQGEPVGKLGATGRVTGPHLDWRMNWFNQRIDPQLLVPPMPATE